MLIHGRLLIAVILYYRFLSTWHYMCVLFCFCGLFLAGGVLDFPFGVMARYSLRQISTWPHDSHRRQQ
jgi:hypothetical protein